MILPVDITALKKELKTYICKNGYVSELNRFDMIEKILDRHTKKSQGVYLQKPGIPGHISQALNEGDGVYRP